MLLCLEECFKPTGGMSRMHSHALLLVSFACLCSEILRQTHAFAAIVKSRRCTFHSKVLNRRSQRCIHVLSRQTSHVQRNCSLSCICSCSYSCSCSCFGYHNPRYSLPSSTNLHDIRNSILLQRIMSGRKHCTLIVKYCTIGADIEECWQSY